jgi:predicted CxxxxCH...CXXCH cytochrome family protein
MKSRAATKTSQRPWHPTDCRARLIAQIAGLSLTLSLVDCQRTQLSDGLTDRQDCSACHGSASNAAPPKAVSGAVSTTEIAVGAHQAHLVEARIAGPVACSECHVVPADNLTHPDLLGRPASVSFGSLATSSNTAPTWDRASARCSNTYCHGATLYGAETRLAPIWTKVDGSQRGCSACHGNPPGGTHTTSTACEACHGAVAGPSGTIKNPARHVNGVVDFNDDTTAWIPRAAPALRLTRYVSHPHHPREIRTGLLPW